MRKPRSWRDGDLRPVLKARLVRVLHGRGLRDHVGRPEERPILPQDLLSRLTVCDTLSVANHGKGGSKTAEFRHLLPPAVSADSGPATAYIPCIDGPGGVFLVCVLAVPLSSLM